MTEPSTIVRIRGDFAAYLVSAAAGADGFQGAVGIGMTSLEAFNAGIGSVPTPITQVGWEGWLWHSFFGVHAGRGVSGPSDGVHLIVDSKAMRKIDDQMIVYAAADVFEVGAATMDVYLDSRMLVKV